MDRYRLLKLWKCIEARQWQNATLGENNLEIHGTLPTKKQMLNYNCEKNMNREKIVSCCESLV